MKGYGIFVISDCVLFSVNYEQRGAEFVSIRKDILGPFDDAPGHIHTKIMKFIKYLGTAA